MRAIAVTKDDQRYLFRYCPGDEPELLKTVLQYARDPQHKLDYADVVAFLRRLRDTMLTDLAQDKVA